MNETDESMIGAQDKMAELIERLRDLGEEQWPVREEAATALEALQAKVERLQAGLLHIKIFDAGDSHADAKAGLGHARAIADATLEEAGIMTKERARFAWLPVQIWMHGDLFRHRVRKVWLKPVVETWCKSIDCSGPGWLAWEDRQ